MKALIYFNYTSCVTREVEVGREEDVYQAIENFRNEITKEEIINSIQESSVEHDIMLKGE